MKQKKNSFFCANGMRQMNSILIYEPGMFYSNEAHRDTRYCVACASFWSSRMLPHAIAIIVLVSSKTYGLTISKPASIYVRNWLKINLSIIRVSTIAFHATCLNLSTTKTQPTTLISIEIANQNSCQTATTLEEFMYFELDMNYKRHTKIAKITVAQQNTANTAW